MLMYSGLKIFGIAHQRVGELLAALDVLLHLHEHLLELGVLDLVGDAFDGGADADAGADHDRELGGEVQHVLGAGAEGDVEAELLASCAGPSAGARARMYSPRSRSCCDAAARFAAVSTPARDLAGGVLGFVAIRRHIVASGRRCRDRVATRIRQLHRSSLTPPATAPASPDAPPARSRPRG